MAPPCSWTATLAAERIRDRARHAKLALFGHIAWELCLDGRSSEGSGLQPTLRASTPGSTAAARNGPRGPPPICITSIVRADPLADRDAFDDGMRQLFAANRAMGRGFAGYQEGQASLSASTACAAVFGFHA